MSMLYSIERLAESLEPSVRAGSACPICLRHIAGRVIGLPSETLVIALEKLRTRKAMWADIARLCLACRTPEEYESLTARMRAQATKCSAGHTSSEINSPSLPDSFYDITTMLLTEMLRTGKRSPMSRLRQGAPLDATRWPESRQDMFVFADSVGMSSLVFRAVRMSSPVAVELINMLLDVSSLRREVLQHVLGPFRTDLLWVAYTSTQSAKAVFYQMPLQGVSPLGARIGEPLGPGYSSGSLPGLLTGLKLLDLGLKPSTAWSGINQFATFVRGFEQSLLSGLDAIAGGVPPSALATVQTVACLLAELINRPAHQLHSALQLQVQPDSASSDMLPTLWSYALWRYLRDAKAFPCGNQPCPTTSNADSGNKLRRCGSCRLVRYCSSECQRKDWRTCREVKFPEFATGGTLFAAENVNVNHKAVCKVVSKLSDSLTRSESADQFNLARQGVILAAEELKTLLSWMTTVGALDRILARMIMASM